MSCRNKSLNSLLAAFWVSLFLYTPSGIAQTADDIAQANVRTVQLYQSGDYAAALAHAKDVLEQADRVLGPDHPETLSSVNNLAELYRRATVRYEAAEPLYVRALEGRERALGPDHPDTMLSVSNLASLYHASGRYEAAEPLYVRALEGFDHALGPDHPDTMVSVSNLASLYHASGRYEAAEPLYVRALEGRERALGPDHPDTLGSVNNLAALYWVTGRYEAAEPLLVRALDGRERVLGPDHPETLISVNNLASLYQATGRYEAAEPLYVRALEGRERALGPDHPDTLQSVNNLAVLYEATGRYEAAEPLYVRALEGRERALGPDHPDTLRSVNNLAVLYRATGRYESAEPILARALEGYERALGPDHPDTMVSVSNLAFLYQATGRYEAAEPLFVRALDGRERALGPDHPDTLGSVNNLAALYLATGRYGEAEPLYVRALEGYERVLGPDDPNTLGLVNNLAKLFSATERWPEAEAMQRKAVLSLDAQVRHSGQAPQHAQAQWLSGAYGDFHLLQLARLGEEAPTDALAAGLLAAQFGRADAAGAALNSAAARLAANDPTIGRQVRALDEVNARLAALKRSRTAAFSDGDTDRARTLGKEIAAEEADALAKSEAIAAAFPDYADLAATRFVTLEELQGKQGLLKSGEALVVFVEAKKTSVMDPAWFALVATKKDIAVVLLPADLADVVKQVEAVRASIKTDDEGQTLSAYDLAAAHALHETFFAPIEEQLTGVDNLLVVPDGPLMSLPLEMLVADLRPEDKTGDEAISWLGDRYTISVLPAVSSLRALRRTAGAAKGEAPLLAFADPALKDVKTGNALMSLSAADTFDTVCDLHAVPATARIADSLTRALGAKSEAVIQGGEATEDKLRQLNASGTLRNARVVAFNTHGLTAAEAGTRLAEPALALTPAGGCGKKRPKALDPDNDGFLTVSEVVGLELDADWVLLTACNTAAADGEPGAEPLSGLVRGFFYSGARALLVSHWPAQVSNDPVIDGPTEMLMAELFSEKNASLSKAKALQAAKAEVRKAYPHPAYWATFSLVGDGR